MPMAKPDHLNATALTELNQQIPVRSRINEHPGAIDVNRMTKRIPASILTWDEPDRTEMPLFHHQTFIASVSYPHQLKSKRDGYRISEMTAIVSQYTK
jgi:hypothetical protein